MYIIGTIIIVGMLYVVHHMAHNDPYAYEREELPRTNEWRD